MNNQGSGMNGGRKYFDSAALFLFCEATNSQNKERIFTLHSRIFPL
ncbi:hypothetical protein GCWU000282_03237 [Catonella morbi ATCC 51271]|uniref:Uncharacterized protein n=1 Tax=Catonella morbi ATCC 51271 TaxID=592026 RepID=V2Y1W3_9FIRM|nr:hypothetical protein GCWU000282_03237 [Catonella morbi ATCC 51271]